jgi:5-amino-6-(5-phosphoribosylamino)uracil reductase
VPDLPGSPEVADRPYTLLSCAMSLDGYLDDASERRLILSDEDDLDRVDEVRASCDAILVGAGTVRDDNPRLLVRSDARRADRVARGLAPTPVKVTVTERAKLSADAAFFTVGDAERLVYCAADTAPSARAALGERATIVTSAQRLRRSVQGGAPVDLGWLCADLYRRGVRRLLVEGGGTVLTEFLAAGLADELHLVLAPFFVGDSRARRFVDDARFPWHADRRARLLESRPVGGVVLLRYALSARCPD